MDSVWARPGCLVWGAGWLSCGRERRVPRPIAACDTSDVARSRSGNIAPGLRLGITDLQSAMNCKAMASERSRRSANSAVGRPTPARADSIHRIGGHWQELQTALDLRTDHPLGRRGSGQAPSATHAPFSARTGIPPPPASNADRHAAAASQATRLAPALERGRVCSRAQSHQSRLEW